MLELVALRRSSTPAVAPASAARCTGRAAIWSIANRLRRVAADDARVVHRVRAAARPRVPRHAAPRADAPAMRARKSRRVVLPSFVILRPESRPPAAEGGITAAYPACTRRRSACGHMTTSPPIIMSKPPIHTHTTSGLNVTRSSAVSAPRTPASTTYVSSFAVVWMPTSVDRLEERMPLRVDVRALLARDDAHALSVAEHLEADGDDVAIDACSTSTRPGSRSATDARTDPWSRTLRRS